MLVLESSTVPSRQRKVSNLILAAASTNTSSGLTASRLLFLARYS